MGVYLKHLEKYKRTLRTKKDRDTHPVLKIFRKKILSPDAQLCRFASFFLDLQPEHPRAAPFCRVVYRINSGKFSCSFPGTVTILF